MPEVPVDKKTRWECQRCGNCCKDIVLTKSESLSIMKNGKPICKFFDEKTKLCLNYENRPFIRKIYPFVIDLDNFVVALSKSLGLMSLNFCFEK